MIPYTEMFRIEISQYLTNARTNKMIHFAINQYFPKNIKRLGAAGLKSQKSNQTISSCNKLISNATFLKTVIYGVK